MKDADNNHPAYTSEEIAGWISRYRRSNLGLRGFAEQHGLSKSSLHYWVYRKRSAKSSQAPVPAPLFREIKVSGGSPFASWGAEVSLSSGLAVRFSAGAAPAWIGAVVAELRRPC